ncbi:hypothetical protein CCR95_11545 [Thiocystis minor]|uniref:MFS transporter n=1 Tax=Thiocystis minor TaxID=61597 RepID=UPI0019144618|nr:MFS transporter [Thiocystis minor]MBK5964696.1 hypothetical protein [Thiocystis minor]
MGGVARPLLNREFVLLCGISCFAFCNMAVFYGFYGHLEAIGIPPAWRGWLLGLEPFTAFALRLFLIPVISVANAARALLIGLLLLVLALVSYQWALTVPWLIPLRILHGAAFVLLVSASITLVVRFIPEDRSAQGFSLFSLASLLPYALMPPLTEWLLPQVASAAEIYAGVAWLALPAILLLLQARGRLRAAVADMDATLTRRPDRQTLREVRRQSGVPLLLGVSLCIYLGYSAVFYFIKTLASQFGTEGVGLFFMLSTGAMIATRLLGSLVLDRLPKLLALRLALAGLACCVLGLALADASLWLTLLAIPYGITVGIALPLLSAAIFLTSTPALRGVNTNLGLFTMDAGFFLTPWLGGALLAAGGTVGQLLGLCAALLVIALALLAVVRLPAGEGRHD